MIICSILSSNRSNNNNYPALSPISAPLHHSFRSPFDSRCSAIHDIRIASDASAWLPCCQQLNALPTDVHIDYNRKVNLSVIHQGSTFSKETAQIFSSYESFSKAICQPLRSSCGPGRPPQYIIQDAQRLEIALAFSPSTCPPMYKYKPTHLVFKQPCMIRKKLAFDLSPNQHNLPSVLLKISLDEIDIGNPYHVIVHEISFGQASDSEVPLPALFFNIPQNEIEECSLKDELKHNRRKIKNKRMRGAPSAGVPAGLLCGGRQGAAASCRPVSQVDYNNPQQPLLPSMGPSPSNDIFRLYYTNDEALYSLIRKTMQLELEKSRIATQSSSAHFSSSSSSSNSSPYSTLKSRENEIHQNLDALHNFFLESWWPVNEGREYVSSQTLVPPASGFYSVPRHDTSHFRQWNSFVQNVNPKSNLMPNDSELRQMTKIGSSSGYANISGANLEHITLHAISNVLPAGVEKQEEEPRLNIFKHITEKNEVLKWVEEPIE